MAPIFWRDKILLAGIEATPGQTPALNGGDAVLVKNVQFTPMEGNDLSRDLELPYFGDQGTVPVELHAKLSFDVELAPSGTPGVAPPWGKLLRGCAVAETLSAGTSVTYNPITNGQESLSFQFWNGTTMFRVPGARGTAMLKLGTQNNPMISLSYTGMYVPAVDQARAVPSFTSWQRPQPVTTLNTPTVQLGGTDMVMRDLELDLGNEVVTRFLVGSSDVLITGKSESLKMTIEATDLGIFDPYDLARQQSELAVNFVHGTGAGRISTLSIPKAQMQRPGQQEVNQGIIEWPLSLKPIPTTGNDQWTLTLT